VKAVILVAGQGKRIQEVTTNPKCLLKVGKETLLSRQLRLLCEIEKITEIIIVVGYKYRLIIAETKNLIETSLVTNEILGEHLRAVVKAVIINQNCFKEIEKYKKIIKAEGGKENPAR